jgi:predicted dehydrogenase
MKQVVQDVRSGVTAVREIPAPIAASGQVIVAIVASLVSAGTERYVVDLAKKSLIGKARERPDHVKRVLQKIKSEGLLATMQQVQAKLDEPMPLGYSSAGVVLECGRGVSEFKPGDRVATAGPHAGIVSIGKNLCARIPGGVSFEQAAYTSVAAIGLEGVRLAKVTLGERVLVLGLGLIGQICVALLKAQGCRVFGVDIDPDKLDLAKQFGADEVGTGSPADSVKRFSGGAGVDAVVITAATASNVPIEFAAEVARVRGRIVLVGVVGLNLPRPPFFTKELEFTVSASLGPGRWDPAYEEKGCDYPIGHVRWTMQRNMEAVLDTIAAGKLPVEKLTTHRFPIERAAEAYDLITAKKEPFLGIVLQYPEQDALPRRRLELSAVKARAGSLGVSMIGAGNFARLMLIPAIQKAEGVEFRGICTAKGLHAEHTGRTKGFSFATTEEDGIYADASTQALFVVTRHDLHASQTTKAIRAGKHVFVEKPLGITVEEIEGIDKALAEKGASSLVMVGFNRRFAPAVRLVREFFADVRTPLTISVRFNAGPLPPNHWTQDEEEGGGRIVGEACHGIDLASYLAGAVPTRVYAESIGGQGAPEVTDDQCFITVRHRNGSVSSVAYLSGGDKAFPKERIEVFGGGKIGVIDDFRVVTLAGGGKTQEKKLGSQDKGHAAGVAAFLKAVKEGGPAPIPWEDLRAVSLASILAVRSLREGVAFDIP